MVPSEHLAENLGHIVLRYLSTNHANALGENVCHAARTEKYFLRRKVSDVFSAPVLSHSWDRTLSQLELEYRTGRNG